MVVGQDDHLSLLRELTERLEDPLRAGLIGLKEDVVEDDWNWARRSDVALDRSDTQREEQLLARTGAHLRNPLEHAVALPAHEDGIALVVDVDEQLSEAAEREAAEELVGPRQKWVLMKAAIALDGASNDRRGQLGLRVLHRNFLDARPRK